MVIWINISFKCHSTIGANESHRRGSTQSSSTISTKSSSRSSSTKISSAKVSATTLRSLLEISKTVSRGMFFAAGRGLYIYICILPKIYIYIKLVRWICVVLPPSFSLSQNNADKNRAWEQSDPFLNIVKDDHAYTEP
mmetsp:Transcript_28465/g.75018  ORF Transcript_28465/g.75018 Transcript_28465/m.75018 type:complete len:138 (-) Transcript_28465:13-426(-)